MDDITVAFAGDDEVDVVREIEGRMRQVEELKDKAHRMGMADREGIMQTYLAAIFLEHEVKSYAKIAKEGGSEKGNGLGTDGLSLAISMHNRVIERNKFYAWKRMWALEKEEKALAAQR